MNNKLTNKVNTKVQTPIEVLLQIDENGMTTARNLYDFLGLDISNYSRWAKVNITENSFAEENIDYFPFVIKDERNPKPTTDYKLTAAFAKKLAMTSHSERGEQARNYFVKVEDTLKKIKETDTYNIKSENPKTDKNKSLEVKEMNARTRMANMYLKLSNVDTLSKQYKSILVSKAAEVLSGEHLLELPKAERKTYSATEIGKMFGVSANKIGSIANKNNLKTEKYGEIYRDKSRYSSKEVDSFRYYENAILVFEGLLGQRAGAVL